MNGDGEISVQDLNNVLSAIFGDSSMLPCPAFADINKDGLVNALDMAIVVNIIVNA